MSNLLDPRQKARTNGKVKNPVPKTDHQRRAAKNKSKTSKQPRTISSTSHPYDGGRPRGLLLPVKILRVDLARLAEQENPRLSPDDFRVGKIFPNTYRASVAIGGNVDLVGGRLVDEKARLTVIARSTGAYRIFPSTTIYGITFAYVHDERFVTVLGSGQ
jgi:hypothetical protein